MSEHNDHAEPNLLPERRPPWLAVGIIAVAVIVLTILIWLPWLARIVAARMESKSAWIAFRKLALMGALTKVSRYHRRNRSEILAV